MLLRAGWLLEKFCSVKKQRKLTRHRKSSSSTTPDVQRWRSGDCRRFPTVDHRDYRIGLIARVHKALQEDDPETMSFNTMESQLECIEDFWEKVEIKHTELVDNEGAADLPYFKKDSFSTGMGLYYEA